MPQTVKTEHPHIVRREGVCGGEPVVDGLRVAVRHVAALHGETILEIADALGITEAQVFHALSYFFDHPDEILEFIAQEDEAHAPDSPGLETLLVRLYFDRHIMTRPAIDLRGRGFDVLSTEQAAKDTASDEEQLAFATTENRAILTFNIRDFAPLYEQWQAPGRPHSGILVSQQLGNRHYGLLPARMQRLLNRFTAEEMVGNLVHLEQFQMSACRTEPAAHFPRGDCGTFLGPA